MCRLSTDQNFVEAFLYSGLVGHRLFDFGVGFPALARRLTVAGAVTHRYGGHGHVSGGGGTFKSINPIEGN